MKDIDYEKQKRRVSKYMDKWFKPAGFGWFDIHVEFAREERDPNVAGDARINWEYRSGDITFYLPVIQDLDDAQVEKTVVHELCHILTAPMQDPGDSKDKKRRNEYATSLVTDALLNLGVRRR